MELSTQTLKKLAFLILGSILFYLSLQNAQVIIKGAGYIWKLFLPLTLGFAIAFLISIPMDRLEIVLFKNKKKLAKYKRPCAFLLTLTGMLALIFLVTFIVFPQLTASMISLSEQIQQSLKGLPQFIEHIQGLLPQSSDIFNNLELDWGSLMQKLGVWLQSIASKLVSSGSGLIGGILGGVATFIIGFMFALYLVFQKEHLILQLKKLIFAFLPEKVGDRLVYIARLTGKTFSNFFLGQCLEAVILGCLIFAGMIIFRLPYALLVGVVVAFTALIPIFGALIGGATGFILIMIQNPVQALWFLLLFFIIQQIEGNLIYPHVVGNSVGLPSIWVFVAVTLGANLMGIMGMILFIPIGSVLYALLREYVNDNLKVKNIGRHKWIPEDNTVKSAKAKK